MDIPEAWTLFGTYIHQDFLIDFPDFFSGIVSMYKDLSVQEKEEIYLFLKELTQSNYADREKLNIWMKSGTEYYVLENQISRFLSEILTVIEQERSGAR